MGGRLSGAGGGATPNLRLRAQLHFPHAPALAGPCMPLARQPKAAPFRLRLPALRLLTLLALLCRAARRASMPSRAPRPAATCSRRWRSSSWAWQGQQQPTARCAARWGPAGQTLTCQITLHHHAGFCGWSRACWGCRPLLPGHCIWALWLWPITHSAAAAAALPSAGVRPGVPAVCAGAPAAGARLPPRAR